MTGEEFGEELDRLGVCRRHGGRRRPDAFGLPDLADLWSVSTRAIYQWTRVGPPSWVDRLLKLEQGDVPPLVNELRVLATARAERLAAERRASLEKHKTYLEPKKIAKRPKILDDKRSVVSRIRLATKATT